MPNKNFLYNTAYFLLSVICLILSALDNGYPLVYPDSGTYIASGFDGQVPVDRPIMYAFFVRHISMAFSLWLVIVMQAIIVTTVLLFAIRHFFKSANYFQQTFLVTLALSLLTGISYYTSQLMPDVFSGVVILGMGLLLVVPDLSKAAKIILSVVVVFSNMAHSSNLLTSTLIIGCMIFFTLILKKNVLMSWKKTGFVTLLVLAGWLLTPLMNYSLGAGFKVSRAPNIFIMGRLVESGVLNEYLHDNCDKKQIPLCEYKDRLPKESWHFLWPAESPLYAGGCRDAAGHHSPCWLLKNEEYQPLVTAVFSEPKYLKMYSAFVFSQTMRQLIDFRNEGLSPMMEGSPVMGIVGWRFKNEYSQYISSEQAEEGFIADVNSRIQNIVICVCMLFLICSFVVKNMRSKIPLALRLFSLIVFSGIFFNALMCVTFSMIAARFQGRVIWLILLLSILIAFYQLRKRGRPAV